MAELKLVVGADVKEAEQALRSLVTDIKITTVAVQKFSTDLSTFGKLPLHSIENIRKSFLNLKNDLSNVKFAAIPPVTADTRPAQQALNVLTNDVKKTALSVGTISASFDKFSTDVNRSLGALSTASLENLKRAFISFKSDLSNVKISALPPVTIETKVAQISLRDFASKVDTTMDGIRADLGNLKVAPIQPADINTAPADQSLKGLANTIKLTGTAIVGASTSIEKFSSDTRKSLGALPLHNIEAFRQAFLSFKNDLGNIKISAIPPIKVDATPAQQSLQTLAQQAEKTGISVSNVALSFQRFSQSISKSFGALPLASIAAFRDAFQDFKTDLTNVKITAIPPIHVDTGQVQQSLGAITKESERSVTSVNTLSATYARWAAQAAASGNVAVNSLREVSQGVASVEGISKGSFSSVVSDVNSVGASFQRFKDQLSQSVGSLSLKSVEDLRQGVLRLKSDLANVTISALPPVEANVKPAIQAVHTLTDELKESGQAVGGVSNAFDKLGKKVSSLNSDAIKKVEKSTISFVKVINDSGAATKTFGSSITNLQKQVASFGGGVRAFGVTFNKTLPPALDKIPRSSNEASLALLNLSRVVQDAPFGFLGIANNLNPLLESFQRLRATTGTTGGALKSLASSLTGAGGIGIALSVVSSALLLFGKELFGAGEKADNNKAKLEALAAAINEVTENVDALTSALAFQNKLGAINVQISGLGDIQDLREQSVAQQQLVADLGDKILKAKENLNAAILENERQRTDESKKIEQDAFKVVRDLQKKEEEERNSGRIIFRQIALQKIRDQKELNDKLNDDLKDFIARAKQLNDELEKIGFLPPVKFSFFDTFKEELAKAKKVFDDFNSKNLKINPKLFTFPSFSEPQIKDKVDRAMGVVREGIRAGIIGLPKIPLTVDVNNSAISTQASNFALLADKELTKAFKTLGGIDMASLVDFNQPVGLNFSVLLETLRKGFGAARNATREELIATAAEVQKGLDSISAILSNIQFEGVVSLGKALGTALASGDVGGIFKEFTNMLADGVTALGKELIKMSGVIQAIKVALKGSLNPVALLAGGIALIAIGAALRSALNKGVPGFAEGGLVFGPTMGLIGEGVGTSRSNPEVIAPLDQLKKMLGDTGGNRLQPIVLRTAVRGDNLLLIQHRTTRRQGRTR